MNYELKKELIDRGYQGVNGRMDFELSELIKACRSNFLKLIRDTGTSWVAQSTKQNKSEAYSRAGTIPEEAVARLWLALNKKI